MERLAAKGMPAQCGFCMISRNWRFRAVLRCKLENGSCPCPSNCLVRCCISIDVVNLFPHRNLENGYRHPGIYQETGRHRCPIPQPTTPSKMNATTVQKK